MDSVALEKHVSDKKMVGSDLNRWGKLVIAWELN